MSAHVDGLADARQAMQEGAERWALALQEAERAGAPRVYLERLRGMQLAHQEGVAALDVEMRRVRELAAMMEQEKARVDAWERGR